MKNKQKVNLGASEKNTLITFLKETKNGAYAPIEKSSLPYAIRQHT